MLSIHNHKNRSHNVLLRLPRDMFEGKQKISRRNPTSSSRGQTKGVFHITPKHMALAAFDDTNYGTLTSNSVGKHFRSCSRFAGNEQPSNFGFAKHGGESPCHLQIQNLGLNLKERLPRLQNFMFVLLHQVDPLLLCIWNLVNKTPL